MRSDMYNVLHDRPRAKVLIKTGRPTRLVEGEVIEPHRQSMRAALASNWGRETRLNLQPLRRYLERSVNRPWSEVFAEIRATLPKRDRTLRDPMDYLDVAVNCWELDGELVSNSSYGGVREVSWFSFYVHPKTGLLHRTGGEQERGKARAEAKEKRKAELLARRRVIDEGTQLQCIDGIWYEVKLGKMSSRAQLDAYLDADWDQRARLRAEMTRFDAVLDREVTPRDQTQLWETYGKDSVYAVSKRQLSSKELKRHGVANTLLAA